MDLKERMAAVSEAWTRITATQTAAADGRLDARARMARLFDAGSFAEAGAFVTRREGLLCDEAREPEDVVCGYGAIDGRLVFAFSQNGGPLGLAGAKKVAALCRAAVKNGAPVVAVYDANGARLQEGSDALAAYGAVCAAVSRAAGAVPVISVVAGVCAGGLAAAACAADIVVMTKGAQLSVAPASVLEEQGGCACAENAAKHGLSAITAADDAAALDAVRELTAYLPSHKLENGVTIPCSDPAERDTSALETVLAAEGHTAIAVASQLVDNGKLVELSGEFAPEALTALCSVGGVVCGVAATNAAVNGGRLTTAAAGKLARFIRLCDRLNLPLVTLCDCDGFDAAAEAQDAELPRALAQLAAAYAQADIPLVTMTTGRATGSAFALLGSKELGADMTFALPSASIGVLKTESAVQFLWNDKLAAAADPAAAKAELAARWEREVTTPLEAAKAGHIDFICSFAEARARIAAALSMLSMKTDLSGLL